MHDLIKRIDETLGWAWLPDIVQHVIEQAVAAQQIPAPTFEEKARAEYILDQFESASLLDTRMDDMWNVYGRLPGQDSQRPAVMVAAHTDTVFPASTELRLRHEGDVIYGPGLGDNCFGLGGMLGLMEALRQQNIVPDCDIWFVATSREEGLGNLDGMKAAYHALKDQVKAVINLEGLAFGHVYHAGIAVKRLRIDAETGGGHSWLHFGRPSAIHGLVQIGSDILNIQPEQSPRTTYNIGMIEGGQGINVIATRASMWLDLRSENQETLAQLEQQVLQVVNQHTSPELRFEISTVGERPAGHIATDHALVQAALAALGRIGVQGVLETGSTDANVPLAAGCPSVTVGITRGGNAHRLDEYVELHPVEAGMRQLILLVLAAANTRNL